MASRADLVLKQDPCSYDTQSGLSTKDKPGDIETEYSSVMWHHQLMLQPEKVSLCEAASAPANWWDWLIIEAYARNCCHLSTVAPSEQNEDSSWCDGGTQVPLVLGEGLDPMALQFTGHVLCGVVAGLSE